MYASRGLLRGAHIGWQWPRSDALLRSAKPRQLTPSLEAALDDCFTRLHCRLVSDSNHMLGGRECLKNSTACSNNRARKSNPLSRRGGDAVRTSVANPVK